MSLRAIAAACRSNAVALHTRTPPPRTLRLHQWPRLGKDNPLARLGASHAFDLIATVLAGCSESQAGAGIAVGVLGGYRQRIVTLAHDLSWEYRAYWDEYAEVIAGTLSWIERAVDDLPPVAEEDQ